MLHRLFLAVLTITQLAVCAHSQGLESLLPPILKLQGQDRTDTTTSLSLRPQAEIESIRATMSATGASIQELGSLIEQARAKLEEVNTRIDEPGQKELQADLKDQIEIAKEAESLRRDSMALMEEILALEDSKRQANDERRKKLEEQQAFETLSRSSSPPVYSLEEADQFKAQLAIAMERQKEIKARGDNLKVDLESVHRQIVKSKTELQDREKDLDDARSQLSAENRKTISIDQIELLKKFAERRGLRCEQTRDRVKHLQAKSRHIEDYISVNAFEQATALIDVSTQRRREEFVSERATVREVDSEVRSEKLQERDQERQTKVAQADAMVRKAEQDWSQALARKSQAESELEKVRREGGNRGKGDLTQIKVELAKLDVARADARKRMAETMIAVAQADFEKARQLAEDYDTINKIRANAVSNSDLAEQHELIRKALETVNAEVSTASRQRDEVRVSHKALERQVEALRQRIDNVETQGDKPLADKLRQQQKSLSQLIELKADHLEQIRKLASLQEERKDKLTELYRRLEKELGISRIWERKPTPLTAEGFGQIGREIQEVQQGLKNSFTLAATRLPDTLQSLLEIRWLTLLLISAIVVYFTLAMILWASHRLIDMQELLLLESEHADQAILRLSLVKVVRKVLPWSGLLVLGPLARLLEFKSGIVGIVAVAGTSTVLFVIGRALLTELCGASTAKRLLDCRDGVAQHIEGFGSAILVFSVVFLPAIHILPHVYGLVGRPSKGLLAELLWIVYRLGIALLFLGLAHRKDLILSLLPVPTTRAATMTVRTIAFFYPVLIVFILSLCVLGAIGYVDLARYLSASTLKSLLVTAAVIGAHRTIQWGLSAFLVGEMTSTQDELSPRQQQAASLVQATSWLARTVLGGLLIVALYFIWGGDKEGFRTIVRWLSVSVTVGPLSLSILSVGQACLIVYLTLLASRYLRQFLDIAVYPTTDFDTGVQYALSMALHYFVLAMGLSWAMEAVGLGMEYVKWFVGAVGVGAGFGLQHIVYNIISGIIVLAERPIKLGDYIEIGGVFGKVEKIAIRATTVCNDSNVEVIIPNADLLSQKLSNWTHSSRMTKLRIPLRVAYGSDPATVAKILIEVAQSSSGVLSTPTPRVTFHSFGDSALEFELEVACKDPAVRLATKSELLFSLESALKRAGIGVPHAVTAVWNSNSVRGN